MKTRFKYIIILFFILFLLTSVLLSCNSEDFSLPTSNNTGIEVSEQETESEGQLSEETMFLNMKAKQDKNPLSDINVRKAIMYAVDRERIIEEIFGGYNYVSNSLLAIGSPFWRPSWGKYYYNLEKASEYLGKSGHGVENPLYLTISAVNNSYSKRIIENIIKEDLQKIGINLWIYNESPKEFYHNYVYSGNFDLGLWSLYVFDKDDILSSFSSDKIPSMETEENRNCENFYWYSNDNVENLLKGLDALQDKEIKKEKIKDIQDILAKDAVILPLYNRLFVFAYDIHLRNVELEVIEDQIFYEIENWTMPLDNIIPEGEKSEIIIGYESDNIDIFNGFKPYSINDLIFKGLWKKNNDGSYYPDLAEAFEQYKNELTEIIGDDISITLKDNIFWSDGNPITSEDVKYTFEYFRYFMEEMEYYSSLDEEYNKIADIEVIDEKSFTIIFDEPVDDWQKLFPMVFKQGHFDRGDNESLLYTRIISSGPYKIIEYDTSEQMVLEVNENYYGKRPEIERIIIKFDMDLNNLIHMLKESEINFLSIPVDPELMNILEEENDMNLIIKEGNLVEHLALSLKPEEE